MAVEHELNGPTNGHANASLAVDNIPRGVHFVGSVPPGSAADVEEVWSKLFSCLPGRLKRVPDGELGSRHYYVNWQAFVFPEAVLRTQNMVSNLSLGTGDTSYVPKLEDIKQVGYDKAAIESYQHFLHQRRAGIIPKDTRFQVSLPSPLEPVAIHVHPPYQAAIAPLYEQRMLEAVANIQDAIPAEDLSIQWDVAVTFGFIETERGNLDNPFFQPWFDNAMEYSMDVLKKVSLATRKDVEMGYHLCYGDVEHQHFVQPKDTSLLVEVANRMIKDVHPAHEISYIHMPVPKDRSDAAYFAPLKMLKIPDVTQLFLGLVHFHDLEGTKERIAAATNSVPKSFGVATECGMGRTPKDQFEDILGVLKEVTLEYIDSRSPKVLPEVTPPSVLNRAKI